jgi:3-oxoadipate enol-lactonase
VTALVGVHYLDEGPRDARVVVLAHAIGTSLEMWREQARVLSADFRVVRYDHRGHGSSPVPAGPYDIADLGGDLLRLMDRLEIERASICGLSLGAMTGLWVAAHAPDRVDRLVCCCVTARPASRQAWADRAATVRRAGLAAIADLVVERWGYGGGRSPLEAIVRAALLATPPEGYAACCDAIERLDLDPELPEISAPTLLIAGASDPAAPPAEARRIARAIPGSSVRVIPGAAHLANIEQPEAVTAAIAEHLAPTATERQS